MCMSEKDELNDDLQQVRREEMSRGRRPIDIGEQKRREGLKRDLRALLRLATESDFREAMLALGLRDGSEEFESALRI